MKREVTNQDLLDRYIHSMKVLLPPDKMDDIAAEIRSNLQSLVEDQETELGRELNRDEMSAILKQHGHPVVVASRYRERPARGLISPDLFPLYWFTLRAIFGGWVTIRVIMAVFVLQGTTPAETVLLTLGRDLLLAAFFIPAGVTLLFAVWEYLEFKYHYSERWKPESLPAVPPPSPAPQIVQPKPAVQIAGGVVWLIFWAMALFWPPMSWVWGGGGVFSPSETVYAMRLPMWLLAFFGVSQMWLNHTRFAAARWRRFPRIAVMVAGCALVFVLLRGGHLLVAGPKWDPAQGKPLATLNQMVGGVLVLACIVSVLACMREFRRLIGRKGRRVDRDHQTA